MPDENGLAVVMLMDVMPNALVELLGLHQKAGMSYGVAAANDRIQIVFEGMEYPNVPNFLIVYNDHPYHETKVRDFIAQIKGFRPGANVIALPVRT